MASVIAGLTGALLRVVGEFDEVGADFDENTGKVTYKFLTTGLPIEQIAEIKARIWSLGGLPAKPLKIIDVKIVEQGPVLARILVTAESVTPSQPLRRRFLRRV